MIVRDEQGHVTSHVTRLVQRIERMPARVRYFLSCAAGIVSVLAMPPFHLWPVLWITLPLLSVLIDTAARMPEAPGRIARWRRYSLGRAAEAGWWFGFGYHVAGLFWIGEAFLIEAEVFAWLLPFAITLLPAGLGLFTAVAAASSRILPRANACARAASLAIGFGVTEWLRGHILTGFPWNVLGTALTAPLPLLQSVAVFGIYGLTVITVLVFAGPFAILQDAATTPAGTAGAWRARWMPAAALALVPLATMWMAGAWRLAAAEPPAATPRPIVRLVQLSIPQRERMQAGNQRRIFDQHLTASLTAPDGTIDNAVGIDVIVWPEAAMPFVPLSQPVALEAIGTLLPPGTQLASGALRVESDARSDARKVFNSLLVFDGGSTAQLAATYDKMHLVPFGEYLPAQRLLEAIGLQQITRERGGFSAGKGERQTITLRKLGKVLPLVCYEVVFPIAPSALAERPDLILAITNDGWFGTLTGPRQHYHQARIRAVEMGVPMIRASSNGISALIDGKGRERGRLELNAVGTLDVRPPPALAPTLYARLGDTIFLTVMLVVGGWLAWRGGK